MSAMYSVDDDPESPTRSINSPHKGDFFALEKPVHAIIAAKLSQYIGLDAEGTTAYDEFIQSDLWKPQSDEICDYLKQLREFRSHRVPDFREVPFHLVEWSTEDEETKNQKEYSSKIQDKSAWCPLEWYAYFMSMTEVKNSADEKGLFYERVEMTIRQRYFAICTILLRELHAAIRHDSASASSKRRKRRLEKVTGNLKSSKLVECVRGQSQSATQTDPSQPQSSPEAAHLDMIDFASANKEAAVKSDDN